MRARLFAYGPADASASQTPPSSLASFKSELFLPFWYRLTQVVLEIPPVRLESSGGVLSTVHMVVQRRDGPRRLRDHDDDDDAADQWRRQDFVTGGSEVRVGSLEYEVLQKLTHLLQCVGNLQGLVRYDFNRLAVYLSFRTPIGGKLPPSPL